MSSRNDPPRLTAYMTLVSVAGCIALAALVLTGGAGDIESLPVFFTFAGGILIGEYVLLQVGGTNGEETISSTFVLAMLLTQGIEVAVLTQVGASLLIDLATRKRLDRAVFNAAQLALSWSAAGVLILVLAGQPGHFEFGPLQLAALLPGMMTFFVVNSTLVRTAEALALGYSIRSHVRRDFVARAWPATMLMAMGPPVAAVATIDLILVPLTILPIAAIHRATKQATEMEHLALHDSLTGLPSRLLFEDVVTQGILGARRTQSRVVVMLLDLDGFKAINDTLGHEHGDELLRRMSSKLQASVGDDVVARIGGDEFAIVLRHLDDPSEAATTAQEVLAALREPLTVNSVTLEIHASMGIATFPEDGEDVNVLLRHADAAMYAAKRTTMRYEFFDAERDGHSPGRLAMAGELARALEEGELEVHYQPKVDLASRKVPAVEALARWTRPGRGAIPPSEFIPVAEHTGLIEPLTIYMLERALDACLSWHREGLDLKVAVNLSVRSILDREMTARIAQMLDQRGLDPSYLELEITESVLMADPARARTLLMELRDLGVALSVDDFGTGYSSLAYLKDLPIDSVKVDRSFVVQIEDQDAEARLVRSIIDLGHNLGLRVVAEGVETEATVEALVAMSCDEAQGYLFSRPLPRERVERWVRRFEARLPVAA